MTEDYYKLLEWQYFLCQHLSLQLVFFLIWNEKVCVTLMAMVKAKLWLCGNFKVWSVWLQNPKTWPFVNGTRVPIHFGSCSFDCNVGSKITVKMTHSRQSTPTSFNTNKSSSDQNYRYSTAYINMSESLLSN